MRRSLLGMFLAMPWLARAAPSENGFYPSRSVHLVLPSTVGGTSDLVARLIASRLEPALGQSVIVEPRAGAAGRIALEYVANAAPDGYTLLLANNGTNAIIPAARDGPSHPAMTFAPVSMLVRLPIVVAVTPSLGVSSLAELIKRARSAPGKLSFASSGIGSTSQLAAAMLFQRAQVHLVHVPYAGTSAAVRDVLSGEVPVLFTHLGTVASLIASGQLRGLAVTGTHRMADFRDLPTVAEAGYRGFDVTTWHGVVAPAGTPRQIILRLQRELVSALALPDVSAQLRTMGMEPVGDTPEQFASAIDADVRHWAEILRPSEAAAR